MQITASQPRIHLQEAGGFTLMEVLIVMVIVAILLAVAVPAYSGLTERADKRAAEHNLRTGMTAAQAFFVDNDTYVGLGNGVRKTPPGILSYDPELEADVGTGAKGKPTATTYCLNATAGNSVISVEGPGPIAWYTKKNCAGSGSSSAP